MRCGCHPCSEPEAHQREYVGEKLDAGVVPDEVLEGGEADEEDAEGHEEDECEAH